MGNLFFGDDEDDEFNGDMNYDDGADDNAANSHYQNGEDRSTINTFYAFLTEDQVDNNGYS